MVAWEKTSVVFGLHRLVFVLLLTGITSRWVLKLGTSECWALGGFKGEKSVGVAAEANILAFNFNDGRNKGLASWSWGFRF